MSRFLQLHVLTAYPAANLNRDDTGAPKTMTFGGAERLRVSSQSLKRAFRTSDLFAARLPDALGTRSQAFGSGLLAALRERGLDEETALARAEKVVDTAKLGKVKKSSRAQTEQLVHLAPEEQAAIMALADLLGGADMPEDLALDLLRHKPRAADIALFGRMLADNSGFNVEAAAQVGHAFTTHRAQADDDYYTAVDDIKQADREADRGAGFIGVQQFGAGLFYLYVCINADLLLENLSGERELAATAAAALVEAALTVSPSGKQNAFASRGRALYALLESGEEAPRNLAAAFQYPVGARGGEDDYLAASIGRLKGLREGFARSYGEQLQHAELDVTNPEAGGLADLLALVNGAFAGRG